MTILRYSNGLYEGDARGKKRDGFGVFLWNSGQLYIGRWLNDQISGEGLLVFSDGRIAYGEFYKNKLHGDGCIIESSNCTIVGRFSYGYMDSALCYENNRWYRYDVKRQETCRDQEIAKARAPTIRTLKEFLGVSSALPRNTSKSTRSISRVVHSSDGSWFIGTTAQVHHNATSSSSSSSGSVLTTKPDGIGAHLTKENQLIAVGKFFGRKLVGQGRVIRGTTIYHGIYSSSNREFQFGFQYDQADDVFVFGYFNGDAIVEVLEQGAGYPAHREGEWMLGEAKNIQEAAAVGVVQQEADLMLVDRLGCRVQNYAGYSSIHRRVDSTTSAHSHVFMSALQPFSIGALSPVIYATGALSPTTCAMSSLSPLSYATRMRSVRDTQFSTKNYDTAAVDASREIPSYYPTDFKITGERGRENSSSARNTVDKEESDQKEDDGRRERSNEGRKGEESKIEQTQQYLSTSSFQSTPNNHFTIINNFLAQLKNSRNSVVSESQVQVKEAAEKVLITQKREKVEEEEVFQRETYVSALMKKRTSQAEEENQQLQLEIRERSFDRHGKSQEAVEETQSKLLQFESIKDQVSKKKKKQKEQIENGSILSPLIENSSVPSESETQRSEKYQTQFQKKRRQIFSPDLTSRNEERRRRSNHNAIVESSQISNNKWETVVRMTDATPVTPATLRRLMGAVAEVTISPMVGSRFGQALSLRDSSCEPVETFSTATRRELVQQMRSELSRDMQQR